LLKKPLIQAKAGKKVFEDLGCSIAGTSRLWDLEPLLSHLLRDWLAIGMINPKCNSAINCLKLKGLGLFPHE